MKLYIAEKPSLARAIAAVLPKPHRGGDGFIELGNGDVVSWCIGHLLEHAEPEDYNAEFKRWRASDLPIIPTEWQLKPRPSSKAQFNILQRLIKQAKHIVHAGDPDREGQLLVDEVLDYCKKGRHSSVPVERLLISDLNPPAVQKALQHLKPNHEFAALSLSALARSRADWLYGINMTRAYTLKGQAAGYQGVLSVGRVQTPLLGLVVRRDDEIEHFVSRPFYHVDVHLSVDLPPAALLPMTASDPRYAELAQQRMAQQDSLVARWQPSGACEPYQDAEGRIVVKALAENVQRRTLYQLATVTSIQRQQKSQAAPLPYNLSSLQIDAAKRFGYSAQQVLDAAQQLYERYQLITYPRSDCRYLPVEQHSQASAVVAAIQIHRPSLTAASQAADLNRRSKAWNTALVDAHHAIIPTDKTQPSQLSKMLQDIYQLIAMQYLLQFYPPARYDEIHVEFTLAGGRFKTQARLETDAGWKCWTRSPQQTPALQDEPATHHQSHEPNTASPQARDSEADSMQQTALLKLAQLQQGQQLWCCQSDVIEKATQPPEPFTDATLLAAMTGISRFVQDPMIKKLLKEHDGLGTEATRAGIIELLFKRGFLVRQGRDIRASATGHALIKALPTSATLPDMTAQWEASLNAIKQQTQSYDAFMQPLTTQLQQLIQQAFAQDQPGFSASLRASMGTSAISQTKVPPKRRRPGLNARPQGASSAERTTKRITKRPTTRTATKTTRTAPASPDKKVNK